MQLPDGYGPDLLEETVDYPVRPPIILITAYGEIEMAVAAMKNGAHDFIQKPIEFTTLEQSIHRANEVVAMRKELNHLRQSQRAQTNFVVGQSPKMKALLQAAQRASAGFGYLRSHYGRNRDWKRSFSQGHPTKEGP